MDRIERLNALFRRRWACPVLAALHRSSGAKLVTLVHTLDSSPGAMRQTLDELIDLGWVARNSGHGHPLRPEYLLTTKGERLAPACDRLDTVIRRLDAADVALRRWSMPVLYAVGDGPARFTEVARTLRTVTDRALSLALKDLSAAALVQRSVIPGPPPGSVYASSDAGAVLLPVLDTI